MKKLKDVIVVGGGPAGLSAGMYASRAGLDTLVLDKNPSAGALGLASKIENYPGILSPKSGEEIISLFRKQAQKFNVKIKQEQVISVDLSSYPKQVVSSEDSYKSKTAIIATGAMGREKTVEGEKEYLGKGVSYCTACDAPFFKNKKVALVGNLKEIMDEVGIAERFAKKVYIISSQKLKKEKKKKLRKENRIFLSGYKLKEVYGNNFVEGIKIKNLSNEIENISLSGVFIYLHGNKPITDFLQDKIKIDKDGCIVTNKKDMSTSVKGAFAAGDVTCKKIRQCVVATSEGCIAGLSAERFITGTKKEKPQWY